MGLVGTWCGTDRLTVSVRIAFISAFFFFLTAVVGVWAAYDRITAEIKLATVVAGLLVALVLGWSSDRDGTFVLRDVGLASCLAATLAALSFGFSRHFESGPTASFLIVVLPLVVGSMGWAILNRRRYVALLTVGACIVSVVGLALTGERTAWLSLCAGLIVGSIAYSRFARCNASSRWSVNAVLGGVAFVFIALGVFTFASLGPTFLQELPRSLAGRLELWHDSTALVEDYFFTGSGLGNTGLVFSSYVFLLHVPFQPQAHNLFLQIAIEHGFGGLIAFTGMFVAAGWSLRKAFNRGSSFTILAAAAITASLSALLVHGMFDSEIYVTHLMIGLFVPLGCAVSLAGGTSNVTHKSVRWPSLVSSVKVGMVSSAIAVSVFAWPIARAQFIANLGAVAQTRAELSRYQWPTWGVQDAVRRDGAVDLTEATKSYAAALAIDPQNATANRRLGQINLSQGDYGAAKQHLEIAYAASPLQRATRQLLGELEAIDGNASRAVELWRTIDMRHGQLDLRKSWYEQVGVHKESARLSAAIDLLAEQRSLHRIP